MSLSTSVGRPSSFSGSIVFELVSIFCQSRGAYSLVRDRYLRFHQTSGAVATLACDFSLMIRIPRRTQLVKMRLVRAEILQDVQRLPDEPFYHQEAIQTMILDILFMYCKLNPSVGGYRQGSMRS